MCISRLFVSEKHISSIYYILQDILHQHPIHAISFSADDKRGRAGNMLAYIAKGRPPARENICYVFEVKPKQVHISILLYDQISVQL